MEKKLFCIRFFQDARGRHPVADFIDSLPKKEQAKIIRTLELHQELGLELCSPHTRQIEGKLWELRMQFNGRAFRFFFFITCDCEIWYLHAVVKKRDKHIHDNIDIAKRRMFEVLNGI